MTDKQELLELLSSMTQEEINELLGKNKKRRQNRGKKTKSTGELHETNEAEERDEIRAKSGGRKKSGNTGRAKRVARRGERPSKQKKGVGPRKSKTLARTEPVDLTSQREINADPWVERTLRTGKKEDVKIDRILNKNWEAQPRRAQAEFYEVECLECGDIWEVPESRIYQDEDGIVFRCDECAVKGRG